MRTVKQLYTQNSPLSETLNEHGVTCKRGSGTICIYHNDVLLKSNIAITLSCDVAAVAFVNYNFGFTYSYFMFARIYD
jgi:hypothetical protein